MAASELDDRFVFLKGGLVVPVEPYLLLLSLERRNFRLSVEERNVLVVQPVDELTDDDVAAIYRLKRHLISLICYEPRADQLP